MILEWVDDAEQVDTKTIKSAEKAENMYDLTNVCYSLGVKLSPNEFIFSNFSIVFSKLDRLTLLNK